MKKSLFSIFAILLLGFSFMAMGDTYNYTTSADEGATYVRYLGQVSLASDSVGNHYTEAFYIGDSNQNTAYTSLVCSNVAGTEDVNVYLECSQDRLNWVTISGVLKDQLTTTQVYDTLNVIMGVNRLEYKSSVWARLKFDGQTNNPSTTVTWSAYLPKNTGAPSKNVAQVLPKR